MITNPNTTPVQARMVAQSANQTVRPALTAQAAKPSAPQTKPVSSTITLATPTRISQPHVVRPGFVQETSVTAPQTVKQSTPAMAQAMPKSTSLTTQRQNGAQANTAMPHQGKADKNGVKFVGVETMPKENNNATTRGYTMITQVPAKSYGVDVSNYQGTDLSPYARQGAKFAIVKLTEGTGYINPYAAGQIASAKANDMLAMGYVFAHSGGNTTEAKQEAEYGLVEAQRAGLPKGSYIAYDYEVGASGSVPANTAAIETFMQTVLQAGYLPLLYSGNAYLHAHVDVNKITNDYKGSLWVASYPTMGATSTPNWNYFPSNPGVAMWQFTDDWKGMKVDGDVATLPLSVEGTQTAAKPAPAPATKPSTTQPQSKPATQPVTSNSSNTTASDYVLGITYWLQGSNGVQDKQIGQVVVKDFKSNGNPNLLGIAEQHVPAGYKVTSLSDMSASPDGKKTAIGVYVEQISASASNDNKQGGNTQTSNSIKPDGQNGKRVTRPFPKPAQSQPSMSDSGKGIRRDTTTQTAGTSEQARTTTKLPDININVAANAQAKAKAKANANVNVKTNSKVAATDQGNSDSCATADNCHAVTGMGNVVNNGGSTQAMDSIVAGHPAAMITPLSATATPVAGTIATPTAVAGRGSVVMPATGQTQGDVAAGLIAVALSVLGTAGLLNRKRQDD